MKRAVLGVAGVIGVLALLGLSFGPIAAVAIFAATAVVIAIGARECRASLGDVVRRTFERSFGSIELAPGSTLVAVVCPDQLEQLPELLAIADAGSGALVVLAIEPAGADLTLPRGAPELLRAQGPRVRSAMADVIARRPVTFMTARGRDVAAVTLDVARRIAAREVLVLATDRSAVDEDVRRAARVWQDLPAPKAPLSVRLVATAARSLEHRFQLAADPPMIIG